jgi:S-DNA-T family DNA segregation ATPase FtsK/SpoIIIE
MAMAYDQSFDTDDGTVPAAMRRFLRRRAFELAGVVLFVGLTATGVALATWSVNDPSFNHATDQAASNWMGYPGAIIADELMQLLGLGVLALIAVPMSWVVTFLRHEAPERPLVTSVFWIALVLAVSGLLSSLPVLANWPLASGLGGNLGDILATGLHSLLLLFVKGNLASLATGLLWFGAVSYLLMKSLRFNRGQARATIGYVREKSRDAFSMAAGGAQHLWLSWSESKRRRDAGHLKPGNTGATDILSRLAPTRTTGRSAERFEPRLGGQVQVPGHADSSTVSEEEAEVYEEELYAEDFEGQEAGEEDFVVDEEGDDEEPAPRVSRTAKPIRPGKKLAKDMQPGFRFGKQVEFELPSLTLLAEPKRPKNTTELSDEVLEQNARMLEGVLEDFGVRGQIINVKPGPVVTLYELEPAPGIKSSRVISLADDIARSMSAISARVAVVQGRNVIGIELPNSKRETVYLRELLGSEAFEKTGQNLAMALGKNIGGEPVFADLARMPHLLIAGTTGSGKSVGINTMILSLLYRLSPERCKLIMIDPKMLELSVYEGIPHLLAPVVTDPHKAVVALKWAVREMEDRYRKMSKVGVRNIDGYNTRLKQFLDKGEKMSRTVQTGFNPASGEPVFEQEDVDMTPMPYIVVIIDEMADLMMVAGKDIEGAVQRLAQMARAAGIHVIMATQRPSVDVITGTIKANFPTRISFQVTSKIDSRTILGEQGAEQLLGQGDMLWMAGGGRITRLHGPFVSDDEVEKIVKHLKAQGAPSYVDAVTEDAEEEYGEPGSMGSSEGGSGDDLYDQAVAVVLRDKKVSTSYVQRRLQVGYNKAASLIERMEKEGLISAANATGKREILVPGDSARV